MTRDRAACGRSWLTRQNVLLWNAASEIELPRQEKRLPKHVLTIDDAERVIDVPDVGDAIGLRDRALLETLYSTTPTPPALGS